MQTALLLIRELNDRILWGMPMVILMTGTGVFLIGVTGGKLFTKFPTVLRHTAGTLLHSTQPPESAAGSITPFQAVCTALAATVGTGNIVGVALAIATGGPGAIFWLWISALAGMAIKYSEVTLAQAYRIVSGSGKTTGGPMYYIRRGMGKKVPAALFAVFAVLASLGIGASVQANALAGGITAAFGTDSRIIALATAGLGAMILIGGLRRIAGIAEFLVPFMSILYIGGCLAALAVNFTGIPGAFTMIFKSAFTGSAALGGFAGASVRHACRIGMARGVFTHEAGMGSAPIAHASASSDHPARQGLWGTFEVFFDSIVLCSITALVILTSGLWQDPLLTSDPRMLSAAALGSAFPGGQYIVTLGICLFAFATIIAWYYYGETCMAYLFRDSGWAILVYRIIYVAMVYAGCIVSMDTVWEISDFFNALMAIPNLAALIALSPVIRCLTDDFFSDPDTIRPKGSVFDCITRYNGQK